MKCMCCNCADRTVPAHSPKPLVRPQYENNLDTLVARAYVMVALRPFVAPILIEEPLYWTGRCKASVVGWWC